MADPSAFRLESRGAEEILWDVAYTSGTSSGQPTPLFNTAHDFFNMLEYTRRTALLLGIHSGDVLANLFPLRGVPHGAFNGTFRTAMVTGARVFCALPGRGSVRPEFNRPSEDVIRRVESQRATVLFGVHSYVRQLVMKANDLGADLSAVRICCLTGESLPDNFFSDLKARFARTGADPWIVNRYGITEMQGALIECRPGGPLHNLAPDQFYFECTHRETGRPLPDGEAGWITLTHLDRRGTVLLRYLIGDLAVIRRDRCPDCGRIGERVVDRPQRRDHLIKIKGTLINPLLIQEVLARRPEVEEHQIVLKRSKTDDRFSPETVVVRVALSRKDESLIQRLKEEIKSAVDITPEIEIVDKALIFDPDKSMKAVRLVDLRDLEEGR